jgi:hypothetical protein
VTAVLTVVACAGAAPAAASRTDQVRREARTLAREVAAPWGPDRQYSNGEFVDEVGGHSSYGEAVLGYALISEGIREHDAEKVSTGLRAMHYATNRYSSANGAVSVFQNMAVGFTYRLAEKRLRDDSDWRSIRSTVRSFMRRQPLVRLRPHPPHFGNHLIVESLEVVNFVRSGLTSSNSSAILGPDRGRNYAAARDFVQDDVPHLFAGDVVRSGGESTLLLSDPPDKPLAYQGLSIGLYARAMELLSSSGKAEVALKRALEASWRLVAPDGDMSYFGRNQEEAWTLAATAYAARIAEKLPNTSPSQRTRFEALARRALERIRDVHLGGPGGIWPIPALRIDLRKGTDAVDHGGFAPYGGLALMFLNMLADTEAPKDASGDEVHADRSGAAILGKGESLFAVQRAGPIWMAVRSGPSVQRPTDIRYDGGLLLVKRLQNDGTWADLLPTRPRLPLHGNDSAGPLIVRNKRGTAVFSGHRITPHGSKGLTMVGAYRALRGDPGIKHFSHERFRPVDCGAQVSFPARGGDVVENSVFLRRTGPYSTGGGEVVSGGTRVTTDPPARVVIEKDYRSATDPDVIRARLRWSVDADRTIKVRICTA